MQMVSFVHFSTHFCWKNLILNAHNWFANHVRSITQCFFEYLAFIGCFSHQIAEISLRLHVINYQKSCKSSEQLSRQIFLIWHQCIFVGLADGICNFTLYIVQCYEELYANILKSFFLNGINTGIYDFVKKRNVFLRCLYVHTLQHLSIILIL